MADTIYMLVYSDNVSSYADAAKILGASTDLKCVQSEMYKTFIQIATSKAYDVESSSFPEKFEDATSLFSEFNFEEDDNVILNLTEASAHVYLEGECDSYHLKVVTAPINLSNQGFVGVEMIENI